MKYLKILLLLIVVIPINCFASTNTYTRTKDNLLVPSDVVVDDNNREIILRTKAVNSEEKLYDFGELLTDSQEGKVIKELKEFIEKSGIDCIIVTVNNLEGFTVDSYITNFYNYNSFQDTGIAFMISISSGQSGIYMKVFGNDQKLHSNYDNNRKIQILRPANEFFVRKDYFATINTYLKGLNGFYGAGNGDYEVKADGTVVRIIPWVEIIILTISLTFIILLIFLYRILRKTSYKYKDELDGKIDKSTYKVELVNEKFLGIYDIRKK